VNHGSRLTATDFCNKICQILTHAPHKKAEAKGGNSYGHCLSAGDLRAIQLPQLPANCSPPTSATRSGICGVRELRRRMADRYWLCGGAGDRDAVPKTGTST
jgi:hypothetical protein